tara:strand:- start:819 stop:1070 length:252 start_codon:yes stop_codon:yes gene_type:complete
MAKASYKAHHKDDAQGHVFLGHDKQGACTIGLTGAAAMTQDELNFYGEIFATALLNLTDEQQRQAIELASKTRMQALVAKGGN